MATREENLKKINDDLEKLSDEELEEVAGGDFVEGVNDSRLLYMYGFMGLNDFYTSSDECYERLMEAWKKAGITCKTVRYGRNKYSLVDGDSITKLTQQEAHEYVKNHFKRIP